MVPFWLNIAVAHWAFIIFLQFQSHVAMMKACDEMFLTRDEEGWYGLWWLLYRDWIDDHSLGLYCYCYFNWVICCNQTVAEAKSWMRLWRGNAKSG